MLFNYRGKANGVHLYLPLCVQISHNSSSSFLHLKLYIFDCYIDSALNYLLRVTEGEMRV